MPTLRDSAGKAYDVPDDQVEAYREQGFTPESDDQRIERIESDVREDIYGGALGAVGALGAGALRTATLGLSDAAISGLGGEHQLNQLRAENPIASVVGEIGGGLSPIGPAGKLTGVGKSILEAGAGAGALTRAGYAAAGAAVEGAGFGAGQYISQVALEDKPLSAEGFVASMGHGALWGAPIGGGLSLAGSAMSRARSLFPQHQVTKESARAAGSEAKSALGQALNEGDEVVAAAQRRLALTELKSGMGETGERVTRRMFGDADPAAIADQVANGAEGAQLSAALERYQVSRSKLSEWIRDEADPELEAALRGLGDLDVQSAPVVPVGEFGAPGKGGFKSSDELAKLAAGTDADGLAPALDATRALRAKGTPPPKSLSEVGAQTDDKLKGALDALAKPTSATAVGKRPTLPSSANADVSLEALLAGTKAQLDDGKSLAEISNASPLRKSYVAGKQLDNGVPLQDVQVPLGKVDDAIGAVADDVATAGGKSIREMSLDEISTLQKEIDNQFSTVDSKSPEYKKLSDAWDDTVERKRQLSDPAYEPKWKSAQKAAPSAPLRDPAMREEEFATYKDSVLRTMTEEEHEAALAYSGASHASINRPLRTGGKMSEDNARRMELIDSAMDRSSIPRDMTLLRGTKDSDLVEKFKAMKPGEEFVDPGYTSTTIGSEIPREFDGAIDFHIAVSAGQKGLPIPALKKGEGEIVLPRGQKFRVDASEWDAKRKKLIMRLTAVSDAPSTAPPANADDSLLALLSGTKAQLDEGKSISQVAAEAVPTHDVIASRLKRTGDDYVEQTLPASSISGRGYYEPKGGGIDKVRVDNARKAIAEGQRDAVKLNVSPAGKITVTDGRHRLAAAIEANAPIKVKWSTGLEPTADDVLRGGKAGGVVKEAAEASDDDNLMALLAGTKKQLDEGAALKNVRSPSPRDAPTPPATPVATLAAPAVDDGTAVDKGLRARIRAAAKADETAAKTVVDTGMRERVQRATDDEAIAKLLSKHVGKNVDVGPEIGRAAKVIGDFEQAGADLVELLGPDAPALAAARAAAFRAATAEQADKAASSTAQAAADIKDKLIPALNGATGGRAGKAIGALSDVGTALEVLKTMGVSVPDISNIPVIGPILSTYLKARAVIGIVGRKGGAIGRSAETLVASKSAEARNRMNAATVAMLDAGAKTARKASVFAVGPAVTLATKLFPGDGDTKSKDPRKLYAARMDELTRATAPGAVRAALSDRIQSSDPHLQDAIVSQVERGLQFLARKAPRQAVMPTMLPGDGKWHPSKSSLEQWGRYVHAVNNPASVLEDLVHGHVTIEGAEVLREVYPALYGEAQRFLLERAPQMQATLPYRRRVMISIMYGVPVDGTMSARHMQYLQPPQPAPQAANANTAPMPVGAPALTAPLNIGQQTMTSLERRAGA